VKADVQLLHFDVRGLGGRRNGAELWSDKDRPANMPNPSSSSAGVCYIARVRAPVISDVGGSVLY
jgi:hypothetical protein